ncbi:PVC-type heme-binding CxxCH protein [Membranihabitans marinus]|uniref:PVC-type heme-binding CxxCH protein n=1 Tax=Membranihabitans marinus TaxID=1227546 RepID=UPI001F3731B8|nr:PVC-type heme-binding CxxCH protein [Membranihabitans marinus]
MNQYNSYTYLLFALTFASCANHSETEKIRAEALSSFEIAEGFQIELIASEPLISDPVAMEIDEDGNMYVVEMHGYPLDKSGSGNVKLLTDTDGDGEMDKVSLFANDLLFPTGVMRWKKGIMVTDPPNVLYFEDTDNDGVADVRDTLLHGFSISNPQHNVNSPMLGLDNWIYIANESAVAAKVYTEEFSDPGSELHFYKQPDAPSLGVNGGGRRIRFKPDELKLEATSSRSQFGQTYDKWGHHFLNSNANHIYQEVIAASYLERNPDLQISNSTEIISDHGHAAEVFPITLNPQHQLLTDLGVFTSACGITAYGGGLFPKEFENSVFVSEPVSNLVHVDIVQEKGSTHVASRKYEQQEFLASKDPWSRPVNNYVGPDGALYVVDYYRRIVEHPEWMSDDVVESGIVYDGVDQGRIYRITPKGTKPANWTRDFSMSDLSNKELVNYLNNPNSWFRRTAQRLILDRSDKSINSELTELVRTKEASLGRLHAAWTMEGLNVLTKEIIIELLKDPVAGIRENAILLSESFLDKEEVVTALLGLQNDENPRVRFQLMCTLGYIDSPKANKVRLEMGMENVEDYWIQIASLSSSSPDLVGLLDAAINHYQKDEKSYKKYISKIVSMISRQNNTAEIKNLIQRALKSNIKESEGWRIAILQGLMAGKSNVDYKSLTFERERKLLYGIVFSNHFKELKETSLSLLTAMGLPVDINIGNAIEKALVVVKSTTSSE